MNDRIHKLREKKQQIEAQLKQLEARERERERKADTRRKIIAGALALEHAEINEEFGRELHRLLFRHVERPQDRELFGLPPKGEDGEANDNGLSGEARAAFQGTPDEPGR